MAFWQSGSSGNLMDFPEVVTGIPQFLSLYTRRDGVSNYRVLDTGIIRNTI